jgi:hypothetical protein
LLNIRPDSFEFVVFASGEEQITSAAASQVLPIMNVNQPTLFTLSLSSKYEDGRIVVSVDITGYKFFFIYQLLGLCLQWLDTIVYVSLIFHK